MAMRYSSGNPTLDALIGGLGRRESSMNFGAVGPATRKGDHAYGFSQVMGANIGPWTQEVLGVRMSPQQYLNNPEAQFAVTSAKLGGYLNKYGNPEDALSMWHSGRPMARSTAANDGFVNTHDYVKQIMTKQDPRSFVASATPQATGAAPMNLPGATLAGSPQGSPAASVGPQSISLGDEEQEPFNNIGSTLANMGASIASLDRGGTGIASLNASNVARNLAAQEAMREKQGGWKYAGQTQNGQGLIFQNPKGEVRIEPLAPGLAGQDQSNLPSSVREFQYRQQNKEYADYMDNKDKLEPSLSQDTRRMYAFRAIKGDNTWTKEIGGDKQGSVDKRAIDEEITTVAKELDLKPDDLLKSRTEQRYRQKVADRIAQIDVNTEVAFNKINAAASNLIETSKQYPRGDVRFLEGLKQKWDEQTNDPKLQSLKTAVDAFALDYATALNPQKTSPTVDDVRNARNKILTTMNQESLEAAVGIVQREIGSIRQNAQRTHEQWFGSKADSPQPESKPQGTTKRLKFNPTTGELE